MKRTNSQRGKQKSVQRQLGVKEESRKLKGKNRRHQKLKKKRKGGAGGGEERKESRRKANAKQKIFLVNKLSTHIHTPTHS